MSEEIKTKPILDFIKMNFPYDAFAGNTIVKGGQSIGKSIVETVTFNYVTFSDAEPEGSPYNSLNKRVWQYANRDWPESIRGEQKDALTSVYDFCKKLLSNELVDSWFVYEYDKTTGTEDLKLLVEKKFDLVLNMAIGRVKGQYFYENDVRDFRIREVDKLELTEEQLQIVFDGILKAVKEKKLSKYTTNEVVAKMVENGLTFEFFLKKITDLVLKKLKSKNGFSISIPHWVFDKFLTTSYSGDSILITSSDKKIKTKILEQDGVLQKIFGGIEGVSGVGGILIEPNSDFLWPNSVFEIQGEKSESLEQFLENYTTLEGGNVADYSFSYLKEVKPDSIFENPNTGWFGSEWLDWTDWSEEDTNGFLQKRAELEYAKFVMQLLLESDSLRSENVTPEDFLNNFLDNTSPTLVENITNLIIIDKEVNRRISLWNELSKVSEDGDLTKEEEEAALLKSMEAWAVGEPGEIKQEVSEEDIKNRQKFFKQCALMINMPTLRNGYRKYLKDQGEVLYDNRFSMVYSQKGGQEKLLSNLLTSADSQSLMEVPPYVLSSLVPKIRLYKVKEINGQLQNTEFIFDQTSNPDRGGSLFLNQTFDKGNGCGLKEFSFEFNGTNPAEARNDIKANLTLFFQSFSDLIRYRTSDNGERYRFVDLLIQPKPDSTGKINDIHIVSDKQYEPSFYRIRADVGYYKPNELVFQDKELYGKIKNAIEVSNKSFFLNMVDHNFNFNSDGSVTLNISYRAYTESLLKLPRLDSLSSPELIELRIKNARALSEELSKKTCSQEKIQELQLAVSASEEIILKKSLSSILDRMRQRGKIFITKVTDSDREQFKRDGFFRSCSLEGQFKIKKDDSNQADLGVAISSDLPEESDKFNFTDSSNGTIQYFFFGDLLYTVLDCIFEGDTGNLRKGVGFKNSKILLGSFEFDPFQQKGIADNVYNIAELPISVDYFSRWFVEEVISQQSTRKTFPVMNFIRSLTNNLMKRTLLEVCVNRNIEKKTIFKTMQVTAFSPDKNDPLLKGNSNNLKMEISKLKSKGIIPLKGGGENDRDPNKFFNYIIVSTAGSSLTYSGNGNYEDDIDEGRLHVGFGLDRGLVKNISLSKSDQQYIREARFFQNGIDGLLQLSAVYVANIEMYGNTLFYPGMEFFFNPYGLGGGPEFGSPTTKGAVANKLGIGGYHTITSVKSSIKPGSFTTSISGQQYYSGDKKDPDEKQTNSEQNQNDNVEEVVQEADEDRCRTKILDIIYGYEEREVKEVQNENIESDTVETEEFQNQSDNESDVSTELIDAELDAEFGAESSIEPEESQP